MLGPVDPSGEYLGHFLEPEKPMLEGPLPYLGDRHLITFGPTGCGKGTRILIPNLLSLGAKSVIVIDPKGELAAVTSDFRKKVSEVVILNPFKVLGLPNAGFNPLASLDPGADTFLDDAAGIAEAIVKIEGDDPHWSESARGLVMAVVMWEVVLAAREKRPPLLENVRRIITEEPKYVEDEDGKMRAVSGFRVTAKRMCAEGGFEIESLVSRFLRDTDEIASIQSNADRNTWWLLSKPMRESLARSDIDFADLKKRPHTVYVILPAERMRTHSVWLRLLIVSALRALYRPGGLKTLFILDEFAQLGHLEPIEDAFGLVRGYGVQLWPILQDLTQLKAIYGDRFETFLANAGVVQAFTPNDLTTADWLSKRGGDTTKVAASFNSGDGTSAKGHSSREGMSYQQVKTPKYMPQDLFGMPAGSGVMFGAGSNKNIPFYAPPYWELHSVKDRAKPNPYYEG